MFQRPREIDMLRLKKDDRRQNTDKFREQLGSVCTANTHNTTQHNTIENSTISTDDNGFGCF